MITILKSHSNGIHVNAINEKRLQHGGESSGCSMSTLEPYMFYKLTKIMPN